LIEKLKDIISFPLLQEYAQDFFSDKCKFTTRRKKSQKPFSPDVVKLKRGKLDNYLLPYFGEMILSDITRRLFEDWRMTLDIANSTNNDITVAMKQIMGEAVRDEILPSNPLELVEKLSDKDGATKDVLTVEEMKKIFPQDLEKAIKIWREQEYFTIIFLLTSSGMRSGEVRALKWKDVDWKNNGILITKAVKNSGEVGSVKEKKNKIVRLPLRTRLPGQHRPARRITMERRKEFCTGNIRERPFIKYDITFHPSWWNGNLGNSDELPIIVYSFMRSDYSPFSAVTTELTSSSPRHWGLMAK